MAFVDFALESMPEAPDLYSVKINGVEMGQHIKELSLNLTAGGFPELTIVVNAEKLSVHSRAIPKLPEPYRAFYEDYEAFYEACRKEFEAHKKTP